MLAFLAHYTHSASTLPLLAVAEPRQAEFGNLAAQPQPSTAAALLVLAVWDGVIELVFSVTIPGLRYSEDMKGI